MEGGGGRGGGWRMIRCGGGGGRGGGGGEEDKSLIMQQTMLRFRPIAPKPVTTEDAVSSGSKSSVLTAGRTKRKYVRAQRNGGSTRNKNNKEQQITTEGDGGADDRKREVTTLQLLPEKNERANSRDAGSWCELDLTVKKNDNDNSNLSSMWSSGGCSDPTVGMQQMRSWVTVECVAGTCMSVVGNGRRCTDAERMRSDLEGDTCPGFISDGMNRVQWVNGAFKRMVTRQSYATEIAVWLVVKETLPYMLSALTCQVKLQYAVEGTEKVSRMVPCDLWRMDGGGFAWRLDVEAALTLGR